MKEQKAQSVKRNMRDSSQLRKPPILAGYTYDPKDAYRARDQNQLLAIRLETNRSCNLRCRYCYAESGGDRKQEAAYKTLTNLIEQAKDLGVRSVVVIGGGEPTLHSCFRELISFIHAQDIVPVIFTNTIAMTSELADFLYRKNASVMGKLDSLQPAIQDLLAGSDGAFDLIHAGLQKLIDAGFTQIRDSSRLRLGVSFVSCKLNSEEIEKIWHFCRQKNIFPNMEVLTPTGRAQRELSDQGISQEEIKKYKLKLLHIDRECYGFDWLPFTPLAASGCLQHLYSLYITIEGNVRPCAPTKFDENPALSLEGHYPYNVNRRSMKEIYEDRLFFHVRNIDKYLEGKCCNCEHLNECIGCRGYAYSVGINKGLDPLAALRGECLQCFK